MNWKQTYKNWKQADLPKYLQDELAEIANNEKKLEDAFYRNLEFGTAGMRGEIGVGTNRMNIYTVRKASEGLARYIEEQGQDAKDRGVVIAYDCRHFSPEFSMEAACVLATHGIQVYLFDSLRPTPELSFAVRQLGSFSGIVITASHNPPNYNGYKVYNEDGGQLPPDIADDVITYINAVEDELVIEVENEQRLLDQGMIQMIGEEIDFLYNEQVISISEQPTLAKEVEVQVVFTPLHGTSNIPVRRALQTLGYDQIHVIQEQEQPDANFPTVKLPNPEEYDAFRLAIEKGKEIDADILIGTDPDADRLGIVVKDNQGEYVILNGNQSGALLLDYILSQKQANGTLPMNGIMLKTIVTSELGRAVATSYGVQTEDVLTGFKFIGEKIKQYENNGEFTFLFGYEESYGCLIKDFARDKDAIQAAVMAVEACAYYKSQDLSMYQALEQLFKKHGYYIDGIFNMTLSGKAGAEKIKEILQHYRQYPLQQLAGVKVIATEDYQISQRIDLSSTEKSEIYLPKSNVIKYFMEDGSWVCLRPSGTEPKIKFYFSVKDQTLQASETKLQAFIAEMKEAVDRI